MEKTSPSTTRKCPACGSEHISRSKRRSLIDQIIRLVGFVPYRCRDYYCSERFYVFTWFQR